VFVFHVNKLGEVDMKKTGSWICILGIIAGLPGYTENVHLSWTDLLIPHIATDSNWKTFLVVENSDDQVREARLNLFSQGIQSETRDLSIAPGGQINVELISADCGKLNLYSPNLSAKVVFHHLLEGGIAEIPLATRRDQTLHFLLSTLNNTNLTWQGIALMNPGSQQAEATVLAFNSHGEILHTGHIQLGANSRTAVTLSSLFDISSSMNITRLEVHSDSALSGLCIRGEQHAQLLFSSALFHPRSGILQIPHIAIQKDQWKNTLLFNNVGKQTETVTITYFRESIPAGKDTFQLDAGRSLEVPIETDADHGWIEVAGDGVFIREQITHITTGNTTEFSLGAGLLRAQIMNWPTVLNENLTWKGVALANPGSTDTTVMLKGTLEDGSILSSQTTIPAKGKYVATLSSVFSSEQAASMTSLTVFTSNPVSAIQIAGSETGQLLFSGAQPLNRAPVYVTLFSHNEESWEGMVATREKYEHYRKDLYNRLMAIREFGAKLDWQSDWAVLKAMNSYENGSILDQTQGKNILKFMVEDLGFSVDPHGHLTTYSYGDLAYLIRQLDVEPSGVIGGCRIVNCGQGILPFELLDWKKDIGIQSDGTIRGNMYPDAVWKPTILSCPAFGSHWFDDYTSGVWKPGSGDDFYTHDAKRDITYIGQGYPHDQTNLGEGTRVQCFAVDGAYIKELIHKIKQGEVSSTIMNTASLHIRDIGYISDTKHDVLEGINRILGELEPFAARGDLAYVTYPEAEAIWNEYYNADPCKTSIGRFSFYEPIAAQAGMHCGKSPVSTLFTINTHDWTQPEFSVETLNRILDIHETAGVFVDVYLTDAMARIYCESYPDLMRRLVESPVVAMSMHIRAPNPYYWNYDFLGLREMPENELRSVLDNYEHFGTDLASGLPRETGLGGADLMTSLFGQPPLAVGGFTPLSPAGEQLQALYNQKGISFVIIHTEEDLELGDMEGSQYVRPEHAAIKIYEHENDYAEDVINQTLVDEDLKNEIFLNIKVHENNFYTVNTPWWAVYYTDPRKSQRLEPPFDLNAWKNHLEMRSSESSEQRWRVYEEAVAYIASHPFSFHSLHCGHLADRLKQLNGSE